jgi:hypothetical protein
MEACSFCCRIRSRRLNLRYLIISESSAVSLGMRRSTARVGDGVASSPTHSGYSSRGLTTGGSSFLTTPRLFRTVPGFIGRAQETDPPKHREAGRHKEGPDNLFDDDVAAPSNFRKTAADREGAFMMP